MRSSWVGCMVLSLFILVVFAGLGVAQDSGGDLDSGPGAEQMRCCWFEPFDTEEVVRRTQGTGRVQEEPVVAANLDFWRLAGSAERPKRPNVLMAPAGEDQGSPQLLQDSGLALSSEDGVVALEVRLSGADMNRWIFLDSGKIVHRRLAGWFHASVQGEGPSCLWRESDDSPCKGIHGANATSLGIAEYQLAIEVIDNGDTRNASQRLLGWETHVEGSAMVQADVRTVGFGPGGHDRRGALATFRPGGGVDWTYGVSVGISMPLGIGFSAGVEGTPRGPSVDVRGEPLPVGVEVLAPTVSRWHLSAERSGRTVLLLKNWVVEAKLSATTLVPFEIEKIDDCHDYHPGNLR